LIYFNLSRFHPFLKFSKKLSHIFNQVEIEAWHEIDNQATGFREKSDDAVAISKLFQFRFCADNLFSVFFFLNNGIDFFKLGMTLALHLVSKVHSCVRSQ
jgi:hypothetical protein